MERPMRLVRWAGVANLLAGVTLIIHALLHPQGTSAAATQESLWLPAHVIGYIGFILGMFGIVGLLAGQIGALKSGGVAGFAMAFAGQTITAGIVFFDSFVAPVLGRDAPSLLDTQGPLFGGPVGIVVIIGGLLVTIGYITFGIATMRAGVLPRWGALLVVLGSWFGLVAAFSHIAFVVGAVIFGIGNVWLGYGLWSAGSR